MKIGDYIRTKDGYICKYTQDNNVLGIETIGNDRYFLIRKSEIVKSSPNIIDLIEVGDYVNDKKIVGIGCLTNGPEKGTKIIDYYIAPNTVYYFKNEDIKSILTKEQFESMKYEVK